VLYVSLRDGTVRRYDLLAHGIEDWYRDVSEPAFGSLVRGVALGSDGSRADLPAPRRFRRRIVHRVEVVRGDDDVPIAERISAICDDVVVTLTMHLGGRVGRFRIDVDRRGTARFVAGSS
jgi:hypothetical protein